jgi:hypothetical protein
MYDIYQCFIRRPHVPLVKWIHTDWKILLPQNLQLIRYSHLHIAIAYVGQSSNHICLSDVTHLTPEISAGL